MSIAVLSAEYGLFGILKEIAHYNKRMDPATAKASAENCSATLNRWAAFHRSIHISLGKDYLPAIQPGLKTLDLKQHIFTGGIGQKLNQIKSFLGESTPRRRVKVEVEGGTGKYSYFLPDWDDLLDPQFDFERDSFSGVSREQRKDKHCCLLMQPNRISDGILVSLAQQRVQKGPLRRVDGTEIAALSPFPLRTHFGLSDDQHLFGDCGAFSYVHETHPTISVDQAVSLYESYGFDFGASVDHIPVPAIYRGGERLELSLQERQLRVDLTRHNARTFFESAQKRKATFNPVGTIQGLDAEQYAKTVREYYDFGYRHLAIGGLVPRSDREVKDIVSAVAQTADNLPTRPWIHLFGIYRPKLQALFRQLRIDSFDSASYFRKAWLRSDQNYLAADGSWYTAIRVPMTSDPRTAKRLSLWGANIQQLRHEERHALDLLCKYGRSEATIDDVLDAVLTYDAHLTRSSDTTSLREKYQRTLRDRPWLQCSCSFCASPDGIHTLIFRGSNRNKRRGAHNTLMLYHNIVMDRQRDRP